LIRIDEFWHRHYALCRCNVLVTSGSNWCYLSFEKKAMMGCSILAILIYSWFLDVSERMILMLPKIVILY